MTDEDDGNREHKDSFFRWLFSIKKNSLSIFNALENTNYSENTDIKITTLSNTLVNGPRNDISFMVEDKILILLEHQSTINGNMALRLLIFVARIYERLTERKDRYREQMLSIPKPEFVVLYNGNEDVPELQELKLSDMFRDLGEGEQPKLELSVKVYNINKGHNEELVSRSKVLKEYSIFVSLIKEHFKSMSLGEAILRAMEDCKRSDVLKVFLKEHEREVYNMILGEWSMDEALEVRAEEAEARGIAIGEARGVAIGEARGVAIGEARGVAIGEARGVAIGEARGVAVGRGEGIAIGEARVARQMKAKGFNIAVISEMTGLSDEEIGRL